MERCQEHVITDGQVERSMKMNGLVERTRRCWECGGLFKTFEMTDDNLARKQSAHDERMKDLKRELDHYKGIFGNVKAIIEDVETLKNDVLMEYEFGDEEGD